MPIEVESLEIGGGGYVGSFESSHVILIYSLGLRATALVKSWVLAETSR